MRESCTKEGQEKIWKREKGLARQRAGRKQKEKIQAAKRREEEEDRAERPKRRGDA